MSNVIPNEETWVGFLPGANAVVDVHAPTAANIAAAVDLTDFLVSLNAGSTGNTVPTPRLKRKFETSIDGTTSASFSADFYRDDENDLAWDTLARGTKGFFLCSPFGGTGAENAPAAGDKVEVWPVSITARTKGALSSNTVQTFTVTASVPEEPDEDAVVGGA